MHALQEQQNIIFATVLPLLPTLKEVVPPTISSHRKKFVTACADRKGAFPNDTPSTTHRSSSLARHGADGLSQNSSKKRQRGYAEQQSSKSPKLTPVSTAGSVLRSLSNAEKMQRRSSAAKRRNGHHPLLVPPGSASSSRASRGTTSRTVLQTPVRRTPTLQSASSPHALMSSPSPTDRPAAASVHHDVGESSMLAPVPELLRSVMPQTRVGKVPVAVTPPLRLAEAIANERALMVTARKDPSSFRVPGFTPSRQRRSPFVSTVFASRRTLIDRLYIHRGKVEGLYHWTTLTLMTRSWTRKNDPSNPPMFRSTLFMLVLHCV